MFFVYGSNHTVIKSTSSQKAFCPKCNSKGTIAFTIFIKYNHIFWVPLFPFMRYGNVTCYKCDLYLERGQMPKNIQEEYDYAVYKSRFTWWQYSGFIALAMFVFMFIYTIITHK